MRFEFKPSFNRSIKSFSSKEKDEIKEVASQLIDMLSRDRSIHKGKRAGIRVIYYQYFSKSQIFMLVAYKKSESTDISKRQLKELAKIVKEGVL